MGRMYNAQSRGEAVPVCLCLLYSSSASFTRFENGKTCFSRNINSLSRAILKSLDPYVSKVLLIIL